MPLETWQEQLRRGSLDPAILLTVSAGPRYGLAIIQHLETFTDLIVTEGTISALCRLSYWGHLRHPCDLEADFPKQHQHLSRQPIDLRGCEYRMASRCKRSRLGSRTQYRWALGDPDLCRGGTWIALSVQSWRSEVSRLVARSPARLQRYGSTHDLIVDKARFRSCGRRPRSSAGPKSSRATSVRTAVLE